MPTLSILLIMLLVVAMEGAEFSRYWLKRELRVR
jgi:hypothetical protein